MTKGNGKFKEARQKSRRYAKLFLENIRAYAGKHKVPDTDTQRFKNYLGLGVLTDDLLASDLELRSELAHFLGEALEDLRAASPDLTFQFWTLFPATGNTSDREPIIDLKGMRASADRTFRSRDLTSVYVTEIQGLGNYPNDGKGRMLMSHVHAITWTGVALDLPALQTEVGAMDCWKTDFDASPVHIQPVREGKGELYYLAHYLLKTPAEVKMLEQRANGPKLKNTEKGFRPEFAARLLELLSQLELDELIRSVGAGKEVRSEAMRRLRAWHKSRKSWSKGRLPTYLHDEFWRVYRAKKKRVVYSPYTIIR